MTITIKLFKIKQKMKKLGVIMAFAFMGLTPFTAANAANSDCTTVNTSCGGTYQICDWPGNTGEMIMAVIILDDILCP